MAKTEPGIYLHVKDGHLASFEEWTDWNGQSWRTIYVQRLADGKFHAAISDPEHGGGATQGKLTEVLGQLHPEVGGPIMAVFEAEPLTEETAQQSFPGYTIMMRQAA